MGLSIFKREPERSLNVHILPDKINAPSNVVGRVTRERLLAALRGSLNSCASTIVSGRAGTGKTTLASDFARACGRRVAWYKVEAPESELSTFFQYLCASVATQRPGFGEGALSRLGDLVGIEDVPLLVEYFVYELLEASEPLLIVVDDLHLVYDAEWVVPFFRRLLPLLPPEAHIILIGRSLPPAPLWRMRSKQTLHVIDEPELAFTLPEAERLYETYGLPAGHASAAWQQTRGRAALLDDRARRQSAAVEAAHAALLEENRRGRSLRLVKGYSAKNRLRTA